MVIRLLRQNRWVALLLGALLVSLSLISLLGMQTTEGEQLEAKPGFAMTALAAEGVPNPAGNKAKIISNGEPVNILSSIVYQPWNMKGEDMLSFPNIERGTTATGNPNSQSKAKTAKAPKAKTAEDTTGNKKGTHVAKSQAESLKPPTTLFFTRTKTLTQDQKDQATWTYELSAEELLLLQKIVMAEAEGEPYEGKVAVANVVLNRLRSANFPDTITEVIYQKHQFSPVANGRLKRVNPNEETIKSVNAALHGHKAVQDDTYFFLSLKLAQDLTVHHSRTFVKKIGNHSFYK